MGLTFDEAIAKAGTYLKNNDLSNSDNNDRFFYIIINDLRKEYAPTINMTKEQYIGLLFKGKGRETSHKNFVFMKDVQKLNEKQVSITSLMNAFVHPETIKVIGELSEEEED